MAKEIALKKHASTILTPRRELTEFVQANYDTISNIFC